MPYYIDHPNRPGDTLQVFEANYHGNNAAEGFWGPVQSSIDWCERNYAVSHYVAEWYNTVSNAALVYFSLVGLFMALRAGLERRFIVMFIGGLVIGVGSAVFHGTLTHIGQQGDETPMMWGISSWIYALWCMDPAYEKANPKACRLVRNVLLGYCVLFTPLHYYLRLVVTFQLGFAVMLLTAAAMLLANLKRCQDPAARKLGFMYVFGTIAGFSVWLVDVHACDHMHDMPLGLPNFQLHAAWHFLTATACYAGPTFLVHRRAALKGLAPQVKWRYLVPVVELHPAPQRPIKKPTSATPSTISG